MIDMEQPMTTDVKESQWMDGRTGYHSPSTAALPDRYPYGYRTVAQVQPGGSTDYEYIPLTQADFLDPQVGDHFVQSDQHIKLMFSLMGRFIQYYRHDPTVGVFGDLKMLWGMPGEKEPAPDVAIVPNLKNHEAYRSSFNVVAEETRPCLVIEIMSPQYPGDDTVKVGIYERAGIEEYLIINPHFEKEDGEIDLTGYRLQNGRYRKIAPDAKGRIFSATTNIWFELDAAKRTLTLVDGRTGKRLLTHDEEHDERLAAEERAAAERQRAEAAEAELARLRKLYGV
ncbi:MAG: Uma2 family endonuclease [Caldilineaceae bacterium]